jgi:TM2 domain-containing membrane protein YozV
MKGQVLDYSSDTDSGLISGDDGSRYTFRGANWSDAVQPRRGLRVDFEAASGTAQAVYVDSSEGVGISVGVPAQQPANMNQPPGDYVAATYPKSKVAAGLLAFFLGGFGIHKFYLGYVGAGIVHIILTITIIGILVNWLILLIETIIYLTKSDQDFHQTYVVGRRSFF